MSPLSQQMSLFKQEANSRHSYNGYHKSADRRKRASGKNRLESSLEPPFSRVCGCLVMVVVSLSLSLLTCLSVCVSPWTRFRLLDIQQTQSPEGHPLQVSRVLIIICCQERIDMARKSTNHANNSGHPSLLGSCPDLVPWL